MKPLASLMWVGGRCLLPPHGNQQPPHWRHRSFAEAQSFSSVTIERQKMAREALQLHDTSSKNIERAEKVRLTLRDGWRRPWHCDVTESVLGLLARQSAGSFHFDLILWHFVRCAWVAVSETDVWRARELRSIKCECCQLILATVRNPAQGGDTLGDHKHQDIFLVLTSHWTFHWYVYFVGRVKESQLQTRRWKSPMKIEITRIGVQTVAALNK